MTALLSHLVGCQPSQGVVQPERRPATHPNSSIRPNSTTSCRAWSGISVTSRNSAPGAQIPRQWPKAFRRDKPAPVVPLPWPGTRIENKHPVNRAIRRHIERIPDIAGIVGPQLFHQHRLGLSEAVLVTSASERKSNSSSRVAWPLPSGEVGSEHSDCALVHA